MTQNEFYGGSNPIDTVVANVNSSVFPASDTRLGALLTGVLHSGLVPNRPSEPPRHEVVSQKTRNSAALGTVLGIAAVSGVLWILHRRGVL